MSTPECQASLTGACLVELEGFTGCTSEDGECIAAGIPAEEEAQ